MEGGRNERGGGRGRKEESIGERREGGRKEWRKGRGMEGERGEEREEGRKREKEKKGGREGGEMDKVHVGEGITCGSEHSNLQNVQS